MSFLRINGNIHIDTKPLSPAQTEKALELASEHMQRSYPSEIQIEKNQIILRNKLFKIKFNRFTNIFKGVRHLKVSLVKKQDGMHVKYEANLSRCFYIAGIYAFVALILITVASKPGASSLFLPIAMWLVAFFTTYASTRAVLPKYLKMLMTDASKAVR